MPLEDMASWQILAEKKVKIRRIIYLDNHRQVKEVVTIDQVTRKDRLGDTKLGFRFLLVRTLARRVMLTTVQRT